jgi:hypothetical protein
MKVLPDAEQRGVVVFKVWKSLDYRPRLVVSFGLIAAGLVVQLVTESFWTGVGPVLAGNLLLLVSGYDNRVDFGAFQHDTHWERVEMERLERLQELDKMMRKWDADVLDVTSGRGAFVGFLVAAGLAAGAIFFDGDARILFLDGLVLLVPHWVTGVRSILRKPKLMVRVDTIRSALDSTADLLGPHTVEPMMLLRGGEDPEAAKLPEDVKFKVDIAGHHEDFLGLYGQVVINDVQGKSYPYFYVVIVAKDGHGLREMEDGFLAPEGMTAEFTRQDNVEVFVLRQKTTKTSGYHTTSGKAVQILREGLAVAESVAAMPGGGRSPKSSA